MRVLPWLTTGDWTASGVEGAVVRRRGNSPLHSTHTRSTRKSRGVAVMGCAFPYTARRFFILFSPFFPVPFSEASSFDFRPAAGLQQCPHQRSEEHTSELQSREKIVCSL